LKFEPKKKAQSGSQRGKGTNYVLNTPPIARSILKKEMDKKLERAISLEKSSFATKVHFKIEAT
jgi:hypothetical protein